MTATYKLRPYLPRDLQVLRDIFIASVMELAEDDYDENQRAAWAARATDEESFARRLAGGLTLIAEDAGGPAGFASLKDGTSIDLLYVSPDKARTGVATVLVDALERIAAARGAVSLTVEASDTAELFFSGRGYNPQQRNTVMVDDVWLANTTMMKVLTPGAAHVPGRA